MSEYERDNEGLAVPDEVIDAEYAEMQAERLAERLDEAIAQVEADMATSETAVGKPYVGNSLELAQPRPPATLFRTDDPVEVVQRATAVADALAPIIEQKQLFKNISGKKHVLVEGWTLLGTMCGVFPVLEGEVERVEVDGVKGFKATVSAQTMQGVVVGRATAFCMRNEGRWRTADDYAVASMAQTRATSKALRVPLGFIVTLAGYEATPSEELDGAEPRPAVPTGDDPDRKAKGLEMVRAGIAMLDGKPGWSEPEILAQASLMWSRPIEKLDDLSLVELTSIFKGMKEHGGLRLETI